MSGTFSSIEKRISEDGSCLAYKTYSKFHGKQVRQHYERELHAFKKLDKDSCEKNHIVQLVDILETSSCFYLVFPFYNFSLHSFPAEKRAGIAHAFIQQITSGLQYLHKNGIVHCDLSPSNILLDDPSGRMLICDLGCAHSIFEESMNDTEEIGTRYYKAPEHLFGSKKYDTSTDIWSLGAIYFHLLFGYPVFAGESDIEQIGRIVRRLGKPSTKVEQEEMFSYPDTNKLMFFSDQDSEYEYEDDSDDEGEIIAMRETKIPLIQLIETAHLSGPSQQVILGSLTWSIRDRLTTAKIQELIDQTDEELKKT